jgi:hypothetical protein
MHADDAPYDRDMMSQAILYVGRKSMANGTITSCRLGLMYRPDRATAKDLAAPAVSRASEPSSGTSAFESHHAANPSDLHPGKQIPPTPKELAHILAELPKEFTKDLSGGDEQRVIDLDTRVFAIDFDDGPADCWLQIKETGPKTFPDRLPTRNTGGFWRIPSKKAHILIWIQPRQSESMSARLRTTLYGMPPGFSLGIDVDSKAMNRTNYDVPVSEVSQLIPQPLWSVGSSKDMRAGDAGFDAVMASQAIIYIGRESTLNGSVAASCQLGLMYRSDRVGKNGDR